MTNVISFAFFFFFWNSKCQLQQVRTLHFNTSILISTRMNKNAEFAIFPKFNSSRTIYFCESSSTFPFKNCKYEGIRQCYTLPFSFPAVEREVVFTSVTHSTSGTCCFKFFTASVPLTQPKLPVTVF